MRAEEASDAAVRIDAQVDEFLHGEWASKSARTALVELFQIEGSHHGAPGAVKLAQLERLGRLLRHRHHSVRTKTAMLIVDLAHPLEVADGQ